MQCEFVGFHGNERSIINLACDKNIYHVSKGNGHWLGDGSYFFEDTPEGKGMLHANSWSMYRNHSNPAILKTNISVNNANLYDLGDSEKSDLFNDLKEKYIENMIRLYGKKPKSGYVDGLFFNMWDKFFSTWSLHIIRRKDYYPTITDQKLSIKSRTPNVFVLCVRNPKCISNPVEISSL